MWKWLSLFAVIVLAIIGAITINLIDPPLRPEVANILDHRPQFAESQSRALFYLLGTFSGANPEQAEEKGAQLWAQRETAGIFNFLTDKPLWPNVDVCISTVCTRRDLRQDPLLARKLAKSPGYLQIYTHLMEYGDSGSQFWGDRQVPAIGIGGPSSRMHRLFLLQLANWLSNRGEVRVFDDITLSNQYLAGFFQTGTNIERTLALNHMVENAEFLQAEIRDDDRLAIPIAVIESFKVPDLEEFSKTGLDNEVILLHYIVQHHNRLGLRPNESVNQFYNLSTQLLSSECDIGELGKCVPDSAWMEFDNPLHYLINPVGRRLVHEFVMNAYLPKKMIGKKIRQLIEIKEQLLERDRQARSSQNSRKLIAQRSY